MNIKEEIEKRDSTIKVLEILKNYFSVKRDNAEASMNKAAVINLREFYKGQICAYQDDMDSIDEEISSYKLPTIEQLITYLISSGCKRNDVKENYDFTVFEVKGDDYGNMIKIVLPGSPVSEEDYREQILSAINLMAVVHESTIEEIINDIKVY